MLNPLKPGKQYKVAIEDIRRGIRAGLIKKDDPPEESMTLRLAIPVDRNIAAGLPAELMHVMPTNPDEPLPIPFVPLKCEAILGNIAFEGADGKGTEKGSITFTRVEKREATGLVLMAKAALPFESGLWAFAGAAFKKSIKIALEPEQRTLPKVDGDAAAKAPGV